MPLLAVVSALKLELKPLLRRLDRVALVPSPAGAWAWQGRLGEQPALIIKAGLGTARVGRILPLLEARPLAAVISLGACGALSPELARGQLFIAERVVSEAGEALACDAELVRALLCGAAAEGVLAHAGALLCCSVVASEPALKAELRRKSGAAAVDMESFALARWALGRGVAFAALKVVSDEAGGWMLPLDLEGWLHAPAHRLARLPLYLGGLISTALGMARLKAGLEAAANICVGLRRRDEG